MGVFIGLWFVKTLACENFEAIITEEEGNSWFWLIKGRKKRKKLKNKIWLNMFGNKNNAFYRL